MLNKIIHKNRKKDLRLNLRKKKREEMFKLIT